MNTSVFKSWHAFLAIGLCAGFIVWLKAIDAAPGSREGSDPTYLLVSGWVALLLMVVVCLYALRKYVHRLGWSPEMKHRVPVARLEEAQSRFNGIRRRIERGQLTVRSEVEQLARRVVSDLDVGKVIRVDVEEGPSGITLNVGPTEPLGRMAKWMHVHIYHGLASGVIVWLHGAGSMASPLGALMNVLTAVVLITGVVGIVLFTLGPTWLTRRERDMNFEAAYVLDRSLARKIEDLYATIDEDAGVTGEFRKLEQATPGHVEGRTSEALAVAIERHPEGEPIFRDLSVLIAQRARVRTVLVELARIRFWINLWRVVHIPASVVLMGVVLLHVISVWWY